MPAATGSESSPQGRPPDRKPRAMKPAHAESPLALDGQLDPELDAENAEFDFSNAPRLGRNELYKRAQGHFQEVADGEDGGRDGHRAEPRGLG
jgi:hypothetical protein